MEKLKKSQADLRKEYEHSIAILKQKYSRLWDKGAFIKTMAEKLGLDEASIRNHHLSTGWNTPQKYHHAYHVNLDRCLKEQEDKI